MLPPILWRTNSVCVWYSHVGPVQYRPSLPRRKSSAVLLHRTYADQVTHDRDRRWKTTEHRIFLHSPLVMWSLSHWGRGTQEKRGRRENLRNKGHAEGGANRSFTDYLPVPLVLIQVRSRIPNLPSKVDLILVVVYTRVFNCDFFR